MCLWKGVACVLVFKVTELRVQWWRCGGTVTVTWCERVRVLWECYDGSNG